MDLAFHDFSGQSYSNSSPVLGEVNRRPFKGRQAVGRVYKKEARYVSLASPPHLAGFRHKVTPPKTGGELKHY